MESKEWFIYVVDHHEGPFTATEIKKLVKAGEARQSSYVWRDGFADWVKLSETQDFGTGGAGTDSHGKSTYLIDRGLTPGPVATTPGPIAIASGPVATTPGPVSTTPTPTPISVSTGSTKTALTPANLVNVVEAPAKKMMDLGFVAATSTESPQGNLNLAGIGEKAEIFTLRTTSAYTGPHSIKGLVRLLNRGEAAPTDRIWKDGWTSFVEIQRIPEIMNEAHPKPVTNSFEAKKHASVTIAALGMQGASSVSYHWYKSTKFTLFLLLVGLAGLYQLAAKGTIDPLLEMTKVKKPGVSLGLTPLPLDTVSSIGKIGGRTLFSQLAPFLPESVAKLIPGLRIPAPVLPADAKAIRRTALTPLTQGAMPVAYVALVSDSDLTAPQFVIVTNDPKVESVKATLQSKDRKVLSPVPIHAEHAVIMSEKMGVTAPFSPDQNRSPLPKGNYDLLVSVQSGTTLAPLTIREFFLGGPAEHGFAGRLADYNNRLKTTAEQELNELRQLVQTLDSVTFDSITQFNKLAASRPSPQRNALWKQFHDRHLQLSSQIKATIEAPKPNRVNVALYDQLKETYLLTESLHQAQTVAIEKAQTNKTARQAELAGLKAAADRANQALENLKRATNPAPPAPGKPR